MGGCNTIKYTLNSWILIDYIFYGMLSVGYVTLYNILSKVSHNIPFHFFATLVGFQW